MAEQPIVHLICNAHIDPVWKWPWEEGAREAISIFRTAADLLDAFPEFIFNHNESVLYEWVEEYDPPLFERIRVLVQVGRWPYGVEINLRRKSTIPNQRPSFWKTPEVG